MGSCQLQPDARLSMWARASAILFLCVFATPVARGQACRSSDLQSCKSCPALEKTLDLSKPDAGEYYRGAFWNGLFAAYRLNCIIVGENLLKRGANPNLGGASGSFLATLVQKWPHNDIKINRKWTDLILKYPIDANWKSPWADESANEIVSNQEVMVDYPELWRLLSQPRQSRSGGRQ